MKQIVPDYYSSFACLMGECRHSCCIGWEIDIDEDTIIYYQSLSGELGERLAKHIDMDGECAHFRLTAQERCPFLNEGGLCDLIIERGEEALCQICADHPRFRNFFSDRIEIGLGMCCEAAAHLILTQRKPVAFIEIEADSEGELPDADEQEMLHIREKCIALIQERTLPIRERVTRLADAFDISMNRPLSDWVELLLSLERLDEAWTAQLQCLHENTAKLSEEWEIPLEQFMVYLLYRHLPAALDDGELTGRIAFCIWMWHIIYALFAVQNKKTMDTLVELCRLYSSEIEYSDENIALILETLAE